MTRSALPRQLGALLLGDLEALPLACPSTFPFLPRCSIRSDHIRQSGKDISVNLQQGSETNSMRLPSGSLIYTLRYSVRMISDDIVRISYISSEKGGCVLPMSLQGVLCLRPYGRGLIDRKNAHQTWRGRPEIQCKSLLTN